MCGCPENGVVLDPFMGSGTTAVVAIKTMRKYIGCEINPEYIKIAEQRIACEKGLWDA
jgi:DNA modification methylase